MGLINLEKNKAGIASFYKMLNAVYGFILGNALIITTLIWMFEYLIDYMKQEISNRLIRYCVQSLPIMILLNIGCALFIFAFLFFKGIYKALNPVPAPVISEPIDVIVVPTVVEETVTKPESVVVKESVTKPEPVVVKEPKESVTFVFAESELTDESAVIQMEAVEE